MNIINPKKKKIRKRNLTKKQFYYYLHFVDVSLCQVYVFLLDCLISWFGWFGPALMLFASSAARRFRARVGSLALALTWGETVGELSRGKRTRLPGRARQRRRAPERTSPALAAQPVPQPGSHTLTFNYSKLSLIYYFSLARASTLKEAFNYGARVNQLTDGTSGEVVQRAQWYCRRFGLLVFILSGFHLSRTILTNLISPDRWRLHFRTINNKHKLLKFESSSVFDQQQDRTDGETDWSILCGVERSFVLFITWTSEHPTLAKENICVPVPVLLPPVSRSGALAWYGSHARWKPSTRCVCGQAGSPLSGDSRYSDRLIRAAVGTWEHQS